MEQLDTDEVPYDLPSSPFFRILHIFYSAAKRVQISSVTKALLRILLIILVVLLIVWALLGLFASSKPSTTPPLQAQQQPAMLMPPRLSIAVHLHPANASSYASQNVSTTAKATATNVLIAFGGAQRSSAASSLTIQNLDDGGSVLQTLATPNSGFWSFGYTLYDNNTIFVLSGQSEKGPFSLRNAQKLHSFDLTARTWDSYLTPIPNRWSEDVTLLSPGFNDDNLYTFGHNGRLLMFSVNVKQCMTLWKSVYFDPSVPDQDAFYESEFDCGVSMNGTMYFLLASGNMFATKDGGKRWQKSSSPLNRRARPTCVALPSQHKIILAGGRLANGTTVDSIEVYDSITDTWTLSTTLKLSRAREGIRSVLLPPPSTRQNVGGGGQEKEEELNVLFCGGSNNDDDVLDICEKLDWTNQRIAPTFSMTMGRSSFGLVATAIMI